VNDPLAQVPAAIRTSLADPSLVDEVLERVSMVPWTDDLDAYTKAVTTIASNHPLQRTRWVMTTWRTRNTKSFECESTRGRYSCSIGGTFFVVVG